VIDLTPKDRLILVNQYKILEALGPDEDEVVEYAKAREILRNGYASEIADLFTGITESYVSHKTSLEVCDVLLMFDNIYFAIEQVGDDEIEHSSSLQFSGYDIHGEDEHLKYCTFRLNQPDFTNRIKNKSGNYNSPRPMIDTYNRMVKAWRESVEPPKLTRDDLVRIAASAIPPPDRR